MSYSSEAIKVQGLKDIFRKEKEITYTGKKSDWAPRRSDGKATGRPHPTWWVGPGVLREGGPSPPAPCPGGRQTHRRGLDLIERTQPWLLGMSPSPPCFLRCHQTPLSRTSRGSSSPSPPRPPAAPAPLVHSILQPRRPDDDSVTPGIPSPFCRPACWG